MEAYFSESALLTIIYVSLGMISISVAVLLRLLYSDFKNKKVW